MDVVSTFVLSAGMRSEANGLATGTQAFVGSTGVEAPIYNETYTVGLLRKLSNSDLLGLAVNWGEQPDNDLRSQTTGELFYRVQFAQNRAITPSLQLLQNPC